ncbi:Arginine repressor [Labeo rohita]|uniref:Arginine repressor n=1 Tax=Labeo rohita TaxID=84645 RepID=A0ABQ8LIW0_LABRO|nr:Arginine repressor [Labeo rohita]
MVSQFGSLGYTIMGKTADLTVVQKTIIDTLQKEAKLQTFIAKQAGCSQSAASKHVNRKLSGRKKCERKRCSTNREKHSLERLVKQNQFKNLRELHKERTEAGVKTSRATTYRRVKEFGYSYRIPLSYSTDNIRGVLPGLRRRRNGLLSSGPKSSFQMRASFVFHLKTKVLESGGRVEKLIAQVA